MKSKSRRRSRRRRRHPAGLGSGGEAPRPPEAACGRNDAEADRKDNEVKVKAAEPPSVPAPCRSGDRGRSAPAAGGYLRAERPAHKPNRRFGRGARTVCCANAQKDRAPEGACFPQFATLTARILTRSAAPVNHCWPELQRGRPFDRSAAFAASLTPGEAPQFHCGFLRWGFAGST